MLEEFELCEGNDADAKILLVEVMLMVLLMRMIAYSQYPKQHRRRHTAHFVSFLTIPVVIAPPKTSKLRVSFASNLTAANIVQRCVKYASVNAV